MLFLTKDRLLIVITFLFIVLSGIFLLISPFLIKPSNKAITVFLCLLGIITLTIGLFGLLFVLFWGVNS